MNYDKKKLSTKLRQKHHATYAIDTHEPDRLLLGNNKREQYVTLLTDVDVLHGARALLGHAERPASRHVGAVAQAQ